MISSWRRRTLLLHLPVIALSLIIFFAPPLLRGEIPLFRDLFYDAYPNHEFLRGWLAQGILPFWTPHTGCGESFIAELEAGIFYPPNLLLFHHLPAGISQTLSMAVHLLFAAGCVYALCRFWRISAPGALLAAVILVWSTKTSSQLEFPALTHASAWLPMIMLLFARWQAHPRLHTALLLAVAFAMQLLAGWPEALWFTALGLVLAAAAHAWLAEAGRLRIRRFMQSIAMLGGTGSLAIALCAFQVLPALHVLMLSPRTGLDPLAADGSVHPLMLLTLLLPSLYGVPGYAGRYWAPSSEDFWLATFYVGFLPLCLLLCAILLHGRGTSFELRNDALRPPIGMLVLIAIAGLLYGMGDHTPVFPLLWELLPPAQWFRWPAKSLLLFVFAAACLSGFALDQTFRTLQNAGTARRACVVCLAAAAGATLLTLLLLANEAALGQALLVRYFNADAVPSSFAHRMPLATIAADLVKIPLLLLLAAVCFGLGARKSSSVAAQYALVAATALELMAAAWLVVPFGTRETLAREGGFADAVSEGSPPARFIRLRMDDINGESAPELYRLARTSMEGAWARADGTFGVARSARFYQRDYARLIAHIEDQALPQAVRLRLLAMLNCRWVITFPSLDGYYTGRELPAPRLDELMEPLPRVYVAGGVIPAAGKDPLLYVAALRDFDPLALALVSPATGQAIERGTPERVEHLVEGPTFPTPNRMLLRVENARAGFLITSERFDAGWRAWVDGAEVAVLEVNDGFLGLRLVPGNHAIELRYVPPGLRVGIVLSALAALLLFGGAAAKRRDYASKNFS